MHQRMLVTHTRYNNDSSKGVRQNVSDALHDLGFCAEANPFSMPTADWFVIGGRWSGCLSGLTWATDVEQEIEELERRHKVVIRGLSYRDAAKTAEQDKVRNEAETRYAAAVPKAYRGLIRYDREIYKDYGYEDDAMVVTAELYAKLLQQHEGSCFSSDMDLGGLEYADLDYDDVSRDFIGKKWLVVVDYHS